jgi:hypothetical protein
MKKFLTLLLVGIVFGIGGYLGGIRTGISAVKSADISTLMWITTIHQLTEKGEYNRAKKLCFEAATNHFRVLQQMEEYSWSYLVIVPWFQLSGKTKQIENAVLARSKAFYLPMAEKMEPTSRTYLEHIKEVPLPATSCSKAASTNCPTPSPTP